MVLGYLVLSQDLSIFKGGGVGISHIFFGNRGNVQRNEGQIPAFHGDKKINSFIYPVGNIFKKTIIEPRH